MDLQITSGSFKGGELIAPASKSQSQRALIFASMASGESELINVLQSPDIFAMITACEAMGAKILCQESGRYSVTGISGYPKLCSSRINVGGSGQVLRFFPAIALCAFNEFSLFGDESVAKRRSMADLLTGLGQLGINFDYLDRVGYAPVNLKGKLSPGFVSVKGYDSQVVSALLIAASYLGGVTTIKVTEPGELPWVKLTQCWLGDQVEYSAKNTSNIYKVTGKRLHEPFSYTVPGDFSSIAYFVAVAAILGKPLKIDGLDWSQPQGDKIFIDILIKLDKNKVIEKTRSGLIVKGQMRLESNLTIDVNECIDMVTILAVIGCFANGILEITGAKVATEKESNRLLAISTELKKMGADISVKEDGLVIRGLVPIKGADCHSWQDHRVAMALTIAALGASGDSIIREAACIEKSNANFYRELNRLGVKIAVI
ncbi:MAG: 3-phosphoshikimate 1-carboxyvinyltransferase [Pseudomonadota bacterium]|nr:3-phosphoshikimate 1-carboxyvinyltransferase [Pseudomonadota bacterium]